MSAVPLVPPRAVAVLRMHLVDPLTLFVVPLAIAASSFAINLAVWRFVEPQGRTSGAGMSLHFLVFAGAVLAVARGLPFALGMGASRRAFAIGTALAGTVVALVLGSIWAVLRAVEVATGGWGRQGRFFDFAWMHRSSGVAVWLMVVLSLTAAFSLGALVAGLRARFAVPGLVIAGVLVVLVAGGLLVLVGTRHWWGEVGRWGAEQAPATASGWLLVATVVLDAATYLVLRRVRAT